MHVFHTSYFWGSTEYWAKDIHGEYSVELKHASTYIVWMLDKRYSGGNISVNIYQQVTPLWLRLPTQLAPARVIRWLSWPFSNVPQNFVARKKEQIMENKIFWNMIQTPDFPGFDENNFWKIIFFISMPAPGSHNKVSPFSTCLYICTNTGGKSRKKAGKWKFNSDAGES